MTQVKKMQNIDVLKIKQLMAKIDQMTHHQVNQILHNPTLQALEANWRGLHLLVSQPYSKKTINIKFLQINYTTLKKDLLHVVEFNQSHLFQKIITETLNQPGGEPFGLLIGNYYFQHNHHDIAMLQEISKVAAAGLAPFIANASSKLFGLKDYTELHSQLDLEAIFNNHEYQRWNQLRLQKEARFIGLTTPNILIRQPHPNETIHSLNDYLWTGCAYYYAASIINSYRLSSWFFQSSNQKILNQKSSSIIERSISDRHITQQQASVLNSLGLLAFYQDRFNHAFYFSSQPSLFKSKKTKHQAHQLLPYTLLASRFAHHIKIICREKIGGFTTITDCQNYLQSWIQRYCKTNSQSQTQYPLKKALVSVSQDPINPQKYNCTLTLLPHHYYEEVITKIKIYKERP